MRRVSAGQLLINSALPEDLQDYSRVLDAKGTTELLRELAYRHPEQYKDTLHKLTKAAVVAGDDTGGFSFGPQHLRQTDTAKRNRQIMQRQLSQILADDNLSDQERERRVVELGKTYLAREPKEIMAEALANKNPFAVMASAGIRGNDSNVRSLLASDLLYTDHRDNIVPYIVARSYGQGLKPWEYYAAMFGTRRGVVDLKKSTADSGFLCLAAGTKVRMADWSERAIEKVRVGDVVLGANKEGQTFPVKVKATFDNGLRECHTFVFREGKSRRDFVSLTATKNHKVLASYLQTSRGPDYGRKLAPSVLPLALAAHKRNYSIKSPTGFDDSSGVDEPRALLLGLLLGNGDFSSGTIYFSCGDKTQLRALKPYMRSLGFRFRWRGPQHPYEYAVLDRQRKGPGYRNRLRTWLASLGLLGCLSHSKFIPAVVNTWSNTSVAAFLAGLFATDGCVSQPNNATTPVISLALVAGRVVWSARDLAAWRFGIYGPTPRRTTSEKLNQYAAKRTASAKMPSVPISRHDLWTFVISDPESLTRFNTAIDMPGAKGALLRELLAAAKPPERRTSFDYHYTHEISVGELQTYDIEVDHPDHLFVLANGLIVSNSKQISQAAHRLLVTALDEDEDDDDPNDGPKNVRGLPVDIDDKDSVGSLLAMPFGDFPKNTVIKPRVLRELKDQGYKRILVRSTTVGGPPQGGIYARDAGIREFGRLPTLGEQVGLNSAQAVGEKVSQGTISSKHSAGVAGQSKAIGGFAAINALVQVPESFPGAAAHSDHDGQVVKIEKAPAGGTNVFLTGGHRIFVPQSQAVTVKAGDEIEAGDVVSDGIPHPAKIVEHKGIGEGRRYLVSALRNVLADANMSVERRNIETLARGLIDHVEATDVMENGAIPEDVIPYSKLEATWQPRQGYKRMPVDAAKGKYLERPVLHYTIGTPLRPSVVNTLKEFKIGEVDVHDDPPPFKPKMVRAMYNLSHDDDWQVQMFGSGLKTNLLDAAQRGSTSDATGTSFVPALAKGVNFGRYGLVQTAKQLPPYKEMLDEDNIFVAPPSIDSTQLTPLNRKPFRPLQLDPPITKIAVGGRIQQTTAYRPPMQAPQVPDLSPITIADQHRFESPMTPEAYEYLRRWQRFHEMSEKQKGNWQNASADVSDSMLAPLTNTVMGATARTARPAYDYADNLLTDAAVIAPAASAAAIGPAVGIARAVAGAGAGAAVPAAGGFASRTAIPVAAETAFGAATQEDNTNAMARGLGLRAPLTDRNSPDHWAKGELPPTLTSADVGKYRLPKRVSGLAGTRASYLPEYGRPPINYEQLFDEYNRHIESGQVPPRGLIEQVLAAVDNNAALISDVQAKYPEAAQGLQSLRSVVDQQVQERNAQGTLNQAMPYTADYLTKNTRDQLLDQMASALYKRDPRTGEITIDYNVDTPDKDFETAGTLLETPTLDKQEAIDERLRGENTVAGRSLFNLGHNEQRDDVQQRARVEVNRAFQQLQKLKVIEDRINTALQNPNLSEQQRIELNSVLKQKIAPQLLQLTNAVNQVNEGAKAYRSSWFGGAAINQIQKSQEYLKYLNNQISSQTIPDAESGLPKMLLPRSPLTMAPPSATTQQTAATQEPSFPLESPNAKPTQPSDWVTPPAQPVAAALAASPSPPTPPATPTTPTAPTPAASPNPVAKTAPQGGLNLLPLLQAFPQQQLDATMQRAGGLGLAALAGMAAPTQAMTLFGFGGNKAKTNPALASNPSGSKINAPDLKMSAPKNPIPAAQSNAPIG